MKTLFYRITQNGWIVLMYDKNKLLILILFVGMLQACGSDDKNQTNSLPSLEESQKVTNMIELGPVKNATVSIKSLDGFELATYRTQDNGEYTINIDELRKSINNYNSSLTYVRITTSGGIDTDPNDDGIYEQEEEVTIKGSVSGVIPVENLLSNEPNRTNLITTGVSEILGNTISVSEEQITKIAQSLGVEDINGDNEIDINDLLNYKMAEHQSRAEVYLRKRLLDNIHNGNLDGVVSFVNSTKLENSMVTPIPVRQTENNLVIKFAEVEINNFIQYGYINGDTTVSFIQYNSNDEIEIAANEVIYYQECLLDGECFKIQKLFFDGQNYFHDYAEYEPAPNIIDNDVTLTVLTNDLISLKEGVSDLERQIIEQKKYMEQFGG
jgi:hypothetical protein